MIWNLIQSPLAFLLVFLAFANRSHADEARSRTSTPIEPPCQECQEKSQLFNEFVGPICFKGDISPFNSDMIQVGEAFSEALGEALNSIDSQKSNFSCVGDCQIKEDTWMKVYAQFNGPINPFVPACDKIVTKEITLKGNGINCELATIALGLRASGIATLADQICKEATGESECIASMVSSRLSKQSQPEISEIEGPFGCTVTAKFNLTVNCAGGSRDEDEGACLAAYIHSDLACLAPEVDP